MKVASVAELEREWSIDDGWDAHDVLDAIEYAEGEARRRAEEERD